MSRSFFRLFCGDGHTRGYAYDDGDYARIRLRRWPFHGTALQSCGHHMALGITWHVDTGGRTYTRIRLRRWRLHTDTLTTMATTHGYAYDDGRSMERPYKAVGITRHWASHGTGHHTACGYRRTDIHAGIRLRRWRLHADRLTAMAVPWNGHYKYGNGHTCSTRCGYYLE